MEANHSGTTDRMTPTAAAHPSPPSPVSSSSPTITPSTSDSSSSPEQYTTPPRHPRQRYPDLGRVPLHKRGTSRTYERLEDLLREAGYKETRIFTPESDRLLRPDASDDQEPGKKQGVGAAVVGFLAGLVTGGTASRSSSSSSPPSEPFNDNSPTHTPRLPRARPRGHSPPASPLANKQNITTSNAPRTSYMTSLSSSAENAADSTITPRVRRPPSRSNHPNNVDHRNLHQLPQHPPSPAGQQRFPSPIHNHSVVDLSVPPVIHQPRPSRAGTYLRHIVSSPNISSSRPNSTPAISRLQHLVNNDANEHNPDTLSRKFLDTISRVVSFGARRPEDATQNRQDRLTVPPPPPLPLPQASQRNTDTIHTLRLTRSSLSQTTVARTSKTVRRSGLTDQTGLLLAPPALFVQLERGRARRSESQVICTSVTCRSAPGSRTSSVVRRKGDNRKQGPKKQSCSRGHYKRKATKDDDRSQVPTLARTKVEGDAWHAASHLPPLSKRSGSRKGKGKFGKYGYVVRRVRGTDTESDAADDDDDDDDDDNYSSDDEGELNLARILVPPKRQQSIRSLRRHLSGEVPTMQTILTGAGPLKRQASSSTIRPSSRASSAQNSSIFFPRVGSNLGPQEEDWNAENDGSNKSWRRTNEDDEELERFADLLWSQRQGNAAAVPPLPSARTRVALPARWNAGYRP